VEPISVCFKGQQDLRDLKGNRAPKDSQEFLEVRVQWEQQGLLPQVHRPVPKEVKVYRV
jgi:hypothetical protein